MSAAIELNHVSKGYRLGMNHGSLREAITQLPRNLIGKKRTVADSELFWSLKDVSFKVERGEVLGIIGHNGAGKSTILKLLSRVTYPTKGTINTQGRLAALIELGAGFHPDLSGRENVYLNGSILGLKRQEIDAAFPSIVDFAGLEQFIDTPVKRYSSGMYVRLAFAVAVHVRADLLLIDEVLSVGDAAFQQKCLAKMKDLRSTGATIIFISHNLWAVDSFCDRVILLEKGQIKLEDKPYSVIEQYRRQQRESMVQKLVETGGTISHSNGKPSDDNVIITDVVLLNEDGNPITSLSPEDALRIRIFYHSSLAIDKVAISLQIVRSDGLSCCTTSTRFELVKGEATLDAIISPIQLQPDNYVLETRIIDVHQPLDHAISPPTLFRINGRPGDAGFTGVFRPNVDWVSERVLG